MNTDNSYWQERFTALMDAQNKKGDKYIAELQKLFTKLMGALEGDIAKWYRRFAKDNSVSYTDAQKILSGKELQELKWQVDEYIRIAKQQNNEEWLKKLQNASSRVHISRLESLQIQMEAQIEELFEGKIQTGVASTLEDIYIDTYYQSAFNVQLGIGEGFDIAKVDKSKLKTVLSAPWSADGSNFSDRIWSNKVSLLNNLQQQLALNTVRGDGVDKMTAAMQKALNTSRYNAERVVRTEVAYVGSLAENNCMKEIGVREYRIVATLDNRTSSICAGLDGKVFKQSEYKAGITAPPFHPNCRSCTIPNVKARGSRTARGADGKSYDVPADMTYKEWKSIFVDGGSKDSLELMSNTFHPTFEKSDAKFNYVPSVQKVKNSMFKMYTDTGLNENSKAIKLTELNLREVSKSMPAGFKMPTVCITDFDKRLQGMDAIAGFDRAGGIMYINSKYDTKAKIRNYLTKQDGWFSSTDISAPYLHELGHKLFEEKIEKLANKRNVSYNVAKNYIDRNMREFIDKRIADKGYIITELSRYAYIQYDNARLTEVLAESYAAKNNSFAKAIVEFFEGVE